MKTSADPALNAFSLAEVAMAIGIVATCLISLLAILGQSVSQAGNSARMADAALIQRNLRTRLLDPEFPKDRQSTAEGWEAKLFLDGRGSVVEKPDEAMFLASLTSGPGLGYESAYLERIEVKLKTSEGSPKFADFILQRCLPLNSKGSP